jgi:flavin-dependent dehydrogenase
MGDRSGDRAGRDPQVTIRRVDVAIVGGGPAGATLAADLAGRGVEVVVLERAPTWRWRAGGVFASPAALAALRLTGLSASTIERVALPIPAMRVETPGGAVFRLTYGAEIGGPMAVGFDRSALDPALLEVATGRGAEVRHGTAVEAVQLDPRGSILHLRSNAGPTRLEARIVVGADGTPSVVARAAGVARSTRLSPRIGLTYHVAEPRAGDGIDARMRVLRDGYVGIAPVPGARLNIGIVLGPSWRGRLAADGARRTALAVARSVPPTVDDPGDWRDRPPADAIAGAWPMGGRVTRRAGPGWLLVGDGAGFLDPFTGEGLHRAFVSAELAGRAIVAALRGDRRAAPAYVRAMHRRFAAKDAVSWLVQAFLAHPAALEYAARRLAARPGVRATMGLVMGDLVPATRGLDPRFIAALLAP